jgi:SAM-dependent methyltransferase
MDFVGPADQPGEFPDMGIFHDLWRATAAIPRPVRRKCVLCGHRVGRFLPYKGGSKTAAPLMIALHMIGSDIDNFECPRCGAHDRERHLLLYLHASGLWEAMPSMCILHFAPEGQLSQQILAMQPVAYVRCDLHPTSAEIEKVDMEAMSFDDGMFDMVIANHVLEHVSDDLEAVSEVARVLRPGGVAVLQTPYSNMLERTWSDPGIASDAARLQAYGQEDHVRLFGRDIFERFSRSGLASHVSSHAELLPGEQAERVGVNPREPFFLFMREA